MWKTKPKLIVTGSQAFSRAWCQLHVFALKSDWLIELFASAVIGQSNSLGFALLCSVFD